MISVHFFDILTFPERDNSEQRALSRSPTDLKIIARKAKTPRKANPQFKLRSFFATLRLCEKIFFAVL